MIHELDEDALDIAVREAMATVWKTNGPRVLKEYAAPDIMERQMDHGRLIVQAYLKEIKKPRHLRVNYDAT